MECLYVVLGFLCLFMLGFPVVLAIAIPCVVYIFFNDLPLDLVAQRTLYALDSFPLVAVPAQPKPLRVARWPQAQVATRPWAARRARPPAWALVGLAAGSPRIRASPPDVVPAA